MSFGGVRIKLADLAAEECCPLVTEASSALVKACDAAIKSDNLFRPPHACQTVQEQLLICLQSKFNSAKIDLIPKSSP